jgi:hypothetical protein
MEGMPNRGVFLPLSHNQQQFLARLEVLDGNGYERPPSSHLRLILRIDGPVSAAILERGLNDILERQSALRLSQFPNLLVPRDRRRSLLQKFASTGILTPGLYLQSEDQAHVELRVVDRSYCDLDENSDIAGLCEIDSGPFVSLPHLRATLCVFANQTHLLSLTMNHLVADGWSLQVLHGELMAVLFPKKETNSLLRCTFAEFVVREQKRCESSYFDQSLNFWKEQWRVYGDARVRPEEFPRSPNRSTRPEFRYVHCKLGPDKSLQLQRLCRSHSVTTYSMFLAAYAMILRGLTLRDKIAVWAHFANREGGTENVIGCFANTHLLGIEFEPDDSAADVLHKARNAVWEAQTHQELPLQHLWHKLGTSPQGPDARVLVDFRRGLGWHARSKDGVEVRALRPPNSHAGRWSPLGLYVRSTPGSMSFYIKYLNRMFDDACVEVIAAALSRVLHALIDDPHTPIRHNQGLRDAVSRRAV